MPGTLRLREAALRYDRPVPTGEWIAWGGILWRWTPRLGRETVLDAARRIGEQNPHLDDEALRHAIVGELIRVARTRQSRPPEVRAAAKIRRLARRGLPPLDAPPPSA